MNSTRELGRHSARALKPYPDYKDSGVQWLGKVPEHWRLPRLGALLRERGEMNGNRQVSEVLSVLRERGVIPYAEKGNIGNKKSEDITRYKVVRPDDIVVNCMNVIIGSVGISRYTGCLSPVYYVLTRRSERDHPRYLNAYFQTKPFQESLVRIGNGILAHRMRIPMELLKCEPFPRPPFEEQAAIVRFLDHADRRIRSYIRAKQKLIALLEEHRQVVIHQAVTGQIDVRTGQPYAAYKDSEVGWLGRVPAHWEVLHLGRLITLTVGFPFKSDGFTQSDNDTRLLRGVNIAPGRIRWDDVVRWPVNDVHLFSGYCLREGDIVLGMDRPIVGDGIRIALTAESDMPSLLLQRVARLRPDRKLLRDFAFQLLTGCSFADYLAPIFTGISVPHVSPEQIKGFRVALPSVAEQQRIVDYLHSSVGALRAVMERTQDEIALLRQYSMRLFADVVTGKLDARDVAARLPEIGLLAADEDPASRRDDFENPVRDERDGRNGQERRA